MKELDSAFSSSSTTNKRANTYNSANWRITPSYREKAKATGHVDSWAYQKLLVQAIKKQDVDEIKRLTSRGANPNSGVDEYAEASAIGIAIKMGCYKCIEAMSPRVDFNFSC